MSHFDRERIPERVVHAKGAGTFVCASMLRGPGVVPCYVCVCMCVRVPVHVIRQL